jgi:serine/threonine protein phosphatase 1
MRFAIGDIHGCLKTFRTLVEEDIGLNRADRLYLLGDYVDRGPDSKGVLDYIMKLTEEGYQLFPLTGNHEDMMITAYLGREEFKHWMINGAEATLRSFGVTGDKLYNPAVVHRIPEAYRYFALNLKVYYVTDDFIFVHAGIDLTKDHPYLDKTTMLWSRFSRIDEQQLGNRIIVHGHTPVPIREIREKAEDPDTNVIDLDGGCVYRERLGLGYLVAMDLDTRRVIARKNME